MNKTTLSVQELASQLGIGLSKAYALVKEPDFPTIRIGTRILIPVDGLHEWLAHEAKGGGTVATEQKSTISHNTLSCQLPWKCKQQQLSNCDYSYRCFVTEIRIKL